jgi:hypothetical protein
MGYGEVHDQSDTPPMEVPGLAPGVVAGKKGFFGGRSYRSAPQELPLRTPRVVHEMPTEYGR